MCWLLNWFKYFLDAHQYPLPIPEDLFTKLNGSIFFVKIYLSDAFLPLEVKEESKKLLTINTHKDFFSDLTVLTSKSN